MYVVDHGGGCCGIMHIAGFGHTVDAAQEAHLDNILGSYRQDEYGQESHNFDTFNILLEAVLTDQQMMAWAPVLKARGFRRTTRFLNSNSGNYCNILHYTPHEPRGQSRRPRPF